MAIDEKVLIERLEKQQKKAFSVLVGWAYEDAIEIINQLAEESNLTPCYLGSPCEYQNEEAKMPPTLLDYITFVDDNNGWIPCSERLPKEKVYDDGYVEPSEDVLVYTRYGNRKISRYWGSRRNKRDYYDWVDIKCQKNEVIAWQPLPELYKGDQK